MDTSDHADNFQAEDEQNPRILESYLPTSSSVLIPEAQDEQNSESLESSLPTTLSVVTEITEARNEPSSGVVFSFPASSSVFTDTIEEKDEQSLTIEPSLPTTASESSQTNPFIKNLLDTYPNTNFLIQEMYEMREKLEAELKEKEVELKKKTAEQEKIISEWNEEIQDDLKEIPKLLKANDVKGAKEKVEKIFYHIEAIEFLINEATEFLINEATEFLIKERLLKKYLQRNLEAAKNENPRIRIYYELFKHALLGNKKHSDVSIQKGKKIGEDPFLYYEATEFMVFLINMVQGEEDIVTPSLVVQETAQASKALITTCFRRYLEETLGVCICLVLKGEVKEAEDLFHNIVRFIKPSDIINRGQVYNYALQRAEELQEVHKFLTSGCLSERYREVVEHRDLLNWLGMEHDNQVEIHTFFMNLFLQDEELMQRKDQLTFAWIEQHDYSYLIKCVCKCHNLWNHAYMNVFNSFKLCKNGIGFKDGSLDNWKEVQLYVEYAFHSSASTFAGVDIIGRLFEVWPKLDVNALYKGITALHVAAYKGHEEVVRILLLKEELDVNVRTGRLITLDNIKNIFESWPQLDANALLKGVMVYKGITTSRVAPYKEYEDVIKELVKCEELKISINENAGIGQLTTALGTNSYGGTFFQRNAYSGQKWNKNKWKMSTYQTTLHIATQQGHAKVVKLLCFQQNLHREKMRYYEEDEAELTALDIVYEKLSSTKEDIDDHASILEIENTLLNMEEIQKGIDRLYRYRQVLVDAANTILVGAALIASVTFAGWLQPPLGYAQYYDFPTPPPAPPGTYDSYIGVQGNVGIQVFALFNSLSFFFAIATVIVGADAAFPMQRSQYIGKVVKTMQRLLQRAIKFLVISLICVLGAFGSAAMVILPPHIYFRKNLVLTILIGGGVCSVALWQLLSRHSEKVQMFNAYIIRIISKYTYIFTVS